MRYPLPIATYRHVTPRASSARLVNAYAEEAPKDGQKAPVFLRRSPGITTLATIGDGPIRGATVMGGVPYIVSGDEMFYFDADGNETQVTGTIAGSERVRMANNGTDIVIVRPANFTGFESDGSTVSQIVDATFTGWGAADVTFIDGYFVFRRPASQQFFNSGLNAVTFNALDIASAEGLPDNLVGLIACNRELILPGEISTEYWWNAANPSGSPFSKSPNGFIEVGCAASYSVEKVNNTVFWLANDRTVRALAGGSPVPTRVSNHGIEQEMQRFSTVDDAFGMGYQMEGHNFYVLTFPFEGRTFVFDMTTSEWHDRESLTYGRWRPNCIFQAHNRWYVGDSESGAVGYLDPDVFTEFSDAQRVVTQFQGVYSDNARVSHQMFEIVINGGHGLTSGQGSNPLATLYVSDDGGETFRAMQTKSLGALGNYKTRVRWYNLGSSRDRVYKLELSDPVQLFMVDAQLQATGLNQ